MEILHPILIHFPMAFLSVFYILELVWSKRIRMRPLFWEIKTFVVIIGALGAIAAVLTGESAEEAIRRLGDGRGALIEVHSTFALATMWIAVFLAVIYCIRAIMRMDRCAELRSWLHQRIGSAWKVLEHVTAFFIDTPISHIIAVIGLVVLIITGTLGGAIVFGQNSDPLASFLVRLLVTQ